MSEEKMLVKNKEVYDELIGLLSDDNATIVSTEILKTFIEEANIENIDVDYVLQDGKMYSGAVNTEFRFNSKKGQLLNKMSSLMNQTDMTEDLANLIKKFEDMVRLKLDKFTEDIKTKLRSNIPLDTSIFPEDVQEDIKKIYIPLKTIKVKKIELNLTFDKNQDGGYTITVKKEAPKNYSAPKSVANELITEHMNTGTSYEEIIANKKAQKDPAYKYVTNVIKKYYESEIYVGLYVDYSPPPQDQAMSKVEEILPNWRDFIPDEPQEK